MTKKFELSAYGVEEMNQKELVEMEGGFPWWLPFFIDAGVRIVTGYSITDLIVEAAEVVQNGIDSNGTGIDGWTWTAADAHGRR
ncbi:MAG: hypothetical protein LBE11_05080 [Prevotellaceae bacterium]|jgi:hypothetical protein|nr:hypothetical protein [Prevotellaceae bacterium]